MSGPGIPRRSRRWDEKTHISATYCLATLNLHISMNMVETHLLSAPPSKQRLCVAGRELKWYINDSEASSCLMSFDSTNINMNVMVKALQGKTAEFNVMLKKGKMSTKMEGNGFKQDLRLVLLLSLLYCTAFCLPQPGSIRQAFCYIFEWKLACESEKLFGRTGEWLKLAKYMDSLRFCVQHIQAAASHAFTSLNDIVKINIFHSYQII